MCGHRCKDKQHCGHPCCNREYYLWVSDGTVDVDESVDVKSPPSPPSNTPVQGAGADSPSSSEGGEDLMDSETVVADASDAAADALADAADEPTEEDKAFVAPEEGSSPQAVYCDTCGTAHPLPNCRPECDCVKCDQCKGWYSAFNSDRIWLEPFFCCSVPCPWSQHHEAAARRFHIADRVGHLTATICDCGFCMVKDNGH